jgi:L-threonylcarbamoyladenylate synthase
LGFAHRKQPYLRTKRLVNVGLKTQILPAGEPAVTAAARVLAAGGLVAFPTETVYGLGADATNAAAIAHLYQAKGRPAFNPLIAHVGDIEAARRIARFDAPAAALAKAFWPGPLTLVLPKTNDCPVADLATAGLETIAVRVPAHSIARDILRAFGGPVVAPSANLSGHVSPTTAAHVQSDLAGRIDLIVDGGPVEVGVESTIVGCFEQPVLLRPGGLPRGEIERVLGRALAQPSADSDDGQPLAPGMLASHYAPRTRVRLDADRVEAGDSGDEFVRTWRSRRGRRQPFRLSSRPRCPGRARHRRHAGAASRAWRGHQRPAAPRRGGAELRNALDQRETDTRTR